MQGEKIEAGFYLQQAENILVLKLFCLAANSQNKENLPTSKKNMFFHKWSYENSC